MEVVEYIDAENIVIKHLQHSELFQDSLKLF